MKSLFITGATGFVGRHLLNRPALKLFPAVTALARPSKANQPPSGNVRWISGDLFDAASYERALHDTDCIVHLAAATGKATEKEHFRVNVEGTRRILEAAKRAGVSRFLLVSSIAAKFPDKKRYFYAQSKQHAEEIVRASGMCCAIVRPTMIFGKNSPVLTGLGKLAGLPVMPIFGDGRTAVQPVDVEDLTDLLLDVIAQDAFDGETLEFGGPEILPIGDLLHKIRTVQRGKAGPSLHVPLGPVIPVLSVLETFLYSALPVTVGQLSSFRNSGAAESNRFFEARRAQMKSVDAMLRAALSP